MDQHCVNFHQSEEVVCAAFQSKQNLKGNLFGKLILKSSKAICRGVKNFSWKKTAMKSLGVLSTDSAPFTSPFQYR